jgi:HEAT repeat protein
MSTFKLSLLLISGLLGATIAFAQQPTPLLTQPADKLLAIIKSDASQKDKADACRELAVIGGKDAVPALAALLPDEKLNHMARYALETIPDTSVDKAFRDALPTLKGRPLVGVIGSIGVRKDLQAVSDLAKLIEAPDAEVVQAAARALGRIANPTAVEALRSAVGQPSSPNQLAFCEGLLRCAETLNAKGDREQAKRLYDQLRRRNAPQHVHVAAVRGAILTGDKNGIALLQEQLLGADYISFTAAVRAAYELRGPDATKALASSLAELRDADRRILVVQALGKRSEPAALSALSTAARTGDKSVRLAAVRALAEPGNPAAARGLSELLDDKETEISQAALESLAGLPGKQVDGLVQSMLHSKESDRRLAAIELVGRRRMTACIGDLVTASTDQDARVRPVALSKLGELGGEAELSSVLDVLPKLTQMADFDAAEQALSMLCSKTETRESCSQKVIPRLYQAQPGPKSVLLRVLSGVGGPGALQAVRAAVDDPNPQVHDAAIRALGAWKTADAAPELLALATSSSNATDRTLCTRSYLGLAANSDLPAAQRLAMCRNAIPLITQSEDKNLLLSVLGAIESPESVALIAPYLDDPAAKDEAGAAVVGLAEKFLKTAPGAGLPPTLIAALEKVSQSKSNDELAKRAKALLQKVARR